MQRVTVKHYTTIGYGMSVTLPKVKAYMSVSYGVGLHRGYFKMTDSNPTTKDVRNVTGFRFITVKPARFSRVKL